MKNVKRVKVDIGRDQARKEKRMKKMFGIYAENDVMELMSFCYATSHEEAVEKARSAGFGKGFRVEEEDD